MRKFLLINLLVLLTLTGFNGAYAKQAIKSEVNPQAVERAEGLRKQAIVAYQNGDYKAVLKSYENIDATQLKSDDYIVIGNAYETLGNLRMASENLIKALELNPKNSNAYYNLGLLHYKNNDYKVAADNFEQAVKADKTSTYALYNLGCSYYAMSDFKSAKKNFLKVIKVDPEFADAYYNLGLSLDALKQSKDALKYFDAYKKLKADDSN